MGPLPVVKRGFWGLCLGDVSRRPGVSEVRGQNYLLSSSSSYAVGDVFERFFFFLPDFDDLTMTRYPDPHKRRVLKS
jgi:hypothetical protein